MSPYSVALAVLFVLLPSSNANTQLIIDTCKKISSSEPSIPNYETCVNFLRSDPRSAKTNLQGLAEIALRLTQKKNFAIQLQIKALNMSSKYDTFVKSCLTDCAEMYSDAEVSLVDALDAFKEKDYIGANIGTSAALDAPSDCEDGFGQMKGVTSPLTRANNEMVQLCGLSLVFTTMFH